MGALREKMIRDLTNRGRSEGTITRYVEAVVALVKYYRRSPDLITLEEVQKYQEHLIVARGLSPQTVNLYMAGIRFLYTTTLLRDWDDRAIPRVKVKRRLPILLSQNQIASLINAVTDLKYRSIIMTLYSAGLRVREATHLQAQDIQSDRMQIHVRFGKGGKERYSVLSELLLTELRRYWKQSPEIKKDWLFPGEDPTKPITTSSVRKVLKEAKERIGIEAKIQCHSLRHCFATELLEKNVNLRVIQLLLGHACLSSTERYTHLRDQRGCGVKSPLDVIAEKILRP